MLEEYQKQVLKIYQLKKENNELTSHLTNPTTANLRKECAVIFHNRSDESIKNILQSFGPLGFHITSAEDILNIDPDKFRPLLKLIKGEISSASAHNVKLLAWLINFETSPYENWKPKIKNEVKDHGILSIFSKKKTRSITIATVLVAGATLVGVIIKPQKQCMYWTGERYQAVSCDIKIGNTPIIALDTFKVSNLKRITRPDTLTKYSLGKVWHIKIDRDSAEFYSSGGYYPLDHKKGLVLSSYYILNKYALSKYKTIK